MQSLPYLHTYSAGIYQRAAGSSLNLILCLCSGCLLIRSVYLGLSCAGSCCRGSRSKPLGSCGRCSQHTLSQPQPWAPVTVQLKGTEQNPCRLLWSVYWVRKTDAWNAVCLYSQMGEGGVWLGYFSVSFVTGWTGASFLLRVMSNTEMQWIVMCWPLGLDSTRCLKGKWVNAIDVFRNHILEGFNCA